MAFKRCCRYIYQMQQKSCACEFQTKSNSTREDNCNAFLWKDIWLYYVYLYNKMNCRKSCILFWRYLPDSDVRFSVHFSLFQHGNEQNHSLVFNWKAQVFLPPQNWLFHIGWTSGVKWHSYGPKKLQQPLLCVCLFFRLSVVVLLESGNSLNTFHLKQLLHTLLNPTICRR